MSQPKTKQSPCLEDEKELERLCSRSGIPSNFANLVAFLRFFRKAGMLSVLDTLAMTTDPGQAMKMLEELLSLAQRLTPQKIDGRDCCHIERLGRERGAEAEWYKRLGAYVKEEGNEYLVCIECPRIPDKDELSAFSCCIERGRLTFSDVIVYALAWG